MMRHVRYDWADEDQCPDCELSEAGICRDCLNVVNSQTCGPMCPFAGCEGCEHQGGNQ